MSDNNKYTLVDELIKETLREKTQKETNIDIEAAWERFNKRYNIKHQKSPRTIAIASSIILVLISAIVFLPNEGSALNLKILENIKSFISGKVQVAHTSFGPNNKKKDTVTKLQPEVASVLKNVPFEILIPMDMMDSYSIQKARVNKVGDSTQITLFIKNQTTDKIRITEVNVIGGFDQGNSYDTEDATMKRANIRGQEATLFSYKNGINRLSWVDRDIFITISGPVNEDELMSLANTLRRANLK